jgi:serine/threonine-protein kinase RsbT
MKEVIEIRADKDIVRARQAVRDFAKGLGFSLVDVTRIATAVSELARNVYIYGMGGRMEMDQVQDRGRLGLRCIFIDEGPGISDIEKAMADGFSTSNGLGHGLPGARRLMENLEIESEVDKGTRVEVVKWK